MATSSVTVQSHHQGAQNQPRRCRETGKLHRSEPGGEGDRQWLTPSQDSWWDTNYNSEAGRRGGGVPGRHWLHGDPGIGDIL